MYKSSDFTKPVYLSGEDPRFYKDATEKHSVF